jgi:SET domain-containing protein
MATKSRFSRKRLARYRRFEEEFVEVRPSQVLRDKLGLPNEMGVFAKKNIPKGTTIGVYYGLLYTSPEIDELYDGGLAKYVLSSTEGYCRDCEDANVSTVMRYINCHRGLGVEPSVEFEDRDTHKDFLVKAMRPIKRGEELFVDYGEEYWGDNSTSSTSTSASTSTSTGDTPIQTSVSMK